MHSLTNKLRSHWPNTHVDIIPVVMSRTYTPHTLIHFSNNSHINLLELNHLTNPPNPRHYIYHLPLAHTLSPMAISLAPHLPHQVLHHMLTTTLQSCIAPYYTRTKNLQRGSKAPQHLRRESTKRPRGLIFVYLYLNGIYTRRP
jgi:hypothetical protein